jgi:hypothetical protein
MSATGSPGLLAACRIADGTVTSSIHRRHRAIELRRFLAKTDIAVPNDLGMGERVRFGVGGCGLRLRVAAVSSRWRQSRLDELLDWLFCERAVVRMRVRRSSTSSAGWKRSPANARYCSGPPPRG